MMLASPRSRCRFNVDNPRYADGFWTARGFKMRRVSGKSSGRMWRRQLRAAEKRTWQREVDRTAKVGENRPR